MPNQRVGGLVKLQVNGQVYNAKGNFKYNLGSPKRESVVGADGVHGYKETAQVPYIEGEITDRPGVSFQSLTKTKDATVTIEKGDGKVIVLRDAFFAGDGEGNTEDGNLQFRFEGLSAEEVG